MAKSETQFTHPMTETEFRQAAQTLTEEIIRYHRNVAEPVGPVDRQPGDLLNLLPASPPKDPEEFGKIARDIHQLIIPALTQWLSPSFFAYFPCNSSFPSILADFLTSGVAQQGMMWLTSPAATELEIRTMDWLAEALNLPKEFTHSSGKGGGVIQGTASESVLVALVAARHKALAKRNKVDDPGTRAQLVAYGSDQTHSSLQKACNISGLCPSQLRILETEKGSLQPETLANAIREDIALGRIPFFVCATVGATSGASVDPIRAIGEICQRHGLWMHVDAAYAGSACLCPEYRTLIDGVELADSFNFNPHKWMLVAFDCSAFFVRDKLALTDSLSVTPEYLRNKATESGTAVDFRDWQIPLGRRFRSLKLWFVMRTYGISGLQSYIRHCVSMAESFEEWIHTKEKRLELVVPRSLGLVCFRVAGNDKTKTDSRTKELMERVNRTGKVFLTHTSLMGHYTIRASIGGQYTQQEHIETLQRLLSDELGKPPIDI